MENRLSRRKVLKVFKYGLPLTIGILSGVLKLTPDECFDLQPVPHIQEGPRLKEALPHSMLLLASPDKNQYPMLGPDGENISDYFNIINLFYGVYEMNNPKYIERVKKIIRNKQTPMISLCPPANPIDGLFRFQRDMPAYLKELEKFLRHFNFRTEDVGILLRPFFEMNGYWSIFGPQVNNPNSYIEAAQAFYYLIKKMSQSFMSVWSPNARFPIIPYFPGNKHFDYASLDGYNKHRRFPHPGTNHPDLAFEDVFASDIKTIQGLTDKNILITETNSARGGKYRVNWFKTALETAATWDHVIGLGGFFWNKASLFDLDPSETDWSVMKDQDAWQNFTSEVMSSSLLY